MVKINDLDMRFFLSIVLAALLLHCSCDQRPPLFKDHLVMSQLWLYHAFLPLLRDHLYSKTTFFFCPSVVAYTGFTQWRVGTCRGGRGGYGHAPQIYVKDMRNNAILMKQLFQLSWSSWQLHWKSSSYATVTHCTTDSYSSRDWESSSCHASFTKFIGDDP